MANKRILVVTPILPFPEVGAEQMDRASGFRQLARLGYEIRVIVKIADWQKDIDIKQIENSLGVKIITIPYVYNGVLTLKSKTRKILTKIKNPLYLDGAAMEFSDIYTKEVLYTELKNWNPDIVWFDYTYLWPLYRLVKNFNKPIITRSVNFEPSHFLQEDGFSLKNLIKSTPKLISEFITAEKSDYLFSITPNEENIYKKIKFKNVETLPLRSLPDFLRDSHQIKTSKPLNVFFIGSTYNVSHNRRALEFIVKNIAPYFYENYPDNFKFYVLGRKVPDELKKYLVNNVIYNEYIFGNESEAFFRNMDIALVPSLFGAGMQQKVFEPLCRGIPTITSSRGIAGYPFSHKKEVYIANDFNGFVNGLLDLRDSYLRDNLSKASIKVSQKIFSQEVLDQKVKKVLDSLIKTTV